MKAYTGDVLTIMVGAGSEVLQADGLMIDGGLWLCPEWLVDPTKALRRPRRLIRVLRFQQMGSAHLLMANDPIPRPVLGGETTVGFEVIQEPELWIALPNSSVH